MFSHSGLLYNRKLDVHHCLKTSSSFGPGCGRNGEAILFLSGTELGSCSVFTEISVFQTECIILLETVTKILCCRRPSNTELQTTSFPV